MKFKRSKHIHRGITLMITMMAIVVLATVIVQFQSETALNARASSYHREKLQCRYAAESAIASASLLIKDILKQQQNPAAADPGTTDPQNTIDPNTIPDPNAVSDPNNATDPNSILLTPAWSFVVSEQKFKVGPAEVEVQIHDESAKWPLVWLFRSPFDKSVGQQEDIQLLLKRYATFLEQSDDPRPEERPLEDSNIIEEEFASVQEPATSQFDINQAVEAALSLAQSLGRKLDLPDPVFTLRKRTSTRGARYQLTSRRGVGTQQREAIKIKRNTEMGLFASRWNQALRSDPANSALVEPLPNRPESFSDFMGIWGNDEININTAPVELIASVYEPVGLTKEIAQAIVEYRREKPFTQKGQVMNVPGADKEILTAVQEMCVTTSRNYSIHVIARLGRVTHRLVGGFYFDDRNKVKISAVISGE